jgi:hypothetical protein
VVGALVHARNQFGLGGMAVPTKDAVEPIVPTPHPQDSPRPVGRGRLDKWISRNSVLARWSESDPSGAWRAFEAIALSP